MDKKLEDLTLHLNYINRKSTNMQYAEMVQEMAYLNQLVLLGIPESQAIELHNKYKCSYEKLTLIVSRGYTTYNEIADVLSKNTFDILEQLWYSNITHNFSTLGITRYKISGGTIKGDLKEPEFRLKIVRI